MLRILVCWLICLPLYAVQTVSVQKNPLDQRSYSALVLSNNLKVLLISDQRLERSAASLDVAVGSFAETEQYLGLAHFLEHMLFLGTKKYPQPDSYSKFIKDNAGETNAFTSSENTQYIFSVNPAKYDEALDHFAQFFIAPLFNPELVERERNAVDSEYKLKLKLPIVRLLAVLSQVANQQHPFHQFSFGNHDTLMDKPNTISVRDALIEFYNKYYSADQMALVLAGPQTISELKSLAKKHFSQIPERSKLRPEYSGQPFDQSSVRDLKIKSLTDERTLYLTFKIPSQVLGYPHKSIEFISYLLNNSTKGSLRYLLWQKNWITALEADNNSISLNQDLFLVGLDLTDEGAKHIDEITRLTLAYFRFLSENAVKAEYFNELKQAAIRNANYREGVDEFKLVKQYVQNLHYLPLKDVVIANDFSAQTTFAPEEVQNLLSQLTVENMLRVFISPEVHPAVTEKWFNVGYSVNQYTKTQLSLWDNPRVSDFAPAEPNQLLPRDFSILKTKARAKIMAPKLAMQSHSLKVWHQNNASFKQPKVSFRLLFKRAKQELSAVNQLKLALTARLIDENLSQYNSVFALAGINYVVGDKTQGLLLNFDMFSDKVKELMPIIAQAMVQQDEISAARFNAIKNNLKRDLYNENQQMPFTIGIARLTEVLTQLPTNADKMSHLEQITFEQVKEYWQELITHTKVYALASGNITELAAVNAVKSLQKILNPEVLAQAEYMPDLPEIMQLKPNTNWGLNFKVDHDDHVLLNYLQVSERGTIPLAKLLLVQTVLDVPLYDTLRTKEQLGYVIFSAPYSISGVPGLLFAVESPSYEANKIYERLNEFFKSYQAKIDELSVTQFNQYKAALKLELLQKPKSINEMANRAWGKVLDGTFGFNLNEELADKLDKLKIQDFRNYYASVLRNHQKSANVVVYTKVKDEEWSTDFFAAKKVIAALTKNLG